MEPKDKNKKTRCPKNALKAGGIWDIPAEVTANLVGCGKSTVISVRAGTRSHTTDLGKRIAIADNLLVEGATLLLSEVKRVVKVQ